MLDAITDTPQVTIAAINGPAIGAGAALISCCDIRIGSPRATICLPEINVGRCGGARHWMRLLPQGVLREMYFTGQPLSADDALRFGAISRIVPGEELRAATAALARTIAGKGAVALRLAKQALNGCEELPLSAGCAWGRPTRPARHSRPPWPPGGTEVSRGLAADMKADEVAEGLVEG
jgi:enoyl-CoA hydratase